MELRYSSDLKSPKKYKPTNPAEGLGQAPGNGQGSPAAQSPQWAVAAQAPPLVAQEPPREAGGSYERALAGPAGPAAEPVTDAAMAFRELRVRPALGGAERGMRAGSPARPAAAPDRPPSPKKRKASYNIDKEFILKDDKVKRNTDTQGDISQARGQLGQLLFEFSQIELNRDLLEAIKRTESKTGRSTGSRPAAPGRLNRHAFELAVAEAGELLQTQLSTVEAHCEDAALRAAILRTYAVQAIATFADEESDSEEEEGEEEEANAGALQGPPHSSDEENNDSNSQQHRGGSSSLEGPQQGASGDAGSQHSHDMRLEKQQKRRHAQHEPRPGSAAGCHSPPHLGSTQRVQAAPLAQARQAGGGGDGAMLTSPQRIQAAGSAAEQASSSFLPDAPPDSAMEDTATAALREQPQQAEQADQAQQPGAQLPPAAAAAAAALRRQQQHQEHQEQQRGGFDSPGAAADDGHMQQRMRMLSLEAEGSAPLQQSSCGGEGEEADGPTDMIGSPAPVTSRRKIPRPLPPPDEREESEGGGRQGEASDVAHSPGRVQRGEGDGSRRASPNGEAEEARKIAPNVRTQQHRRHQQHHLQQPAAVAAIEAAHQGEHAGQEGSEGNSGGQASSAAAEPPKRQRRSGDLLPPLHEHSSQQARRISDPGGLAPEGSAAARRALILGSLQARLPGEHQHPQQQQTQQQQAQLPSPPPRLPLSGHQQQQQQQLEARRLGGEPGQQQHQGAAGEGGEEAAVAEPEEGPPSDAALRLRGASSGSSVWGSTLVCADLTVNDVASQYWPFLRSAMQGQAAQLQAGDKELVASLVRMLGDAITGTYIAEAGTGQRPASEAKSLVAATAFDDFFKAKVAAEFTGTLL